MCSVCTQEVGGLSLSQHWGVYKYWLAATTLFGLVCEWRCRWRGCCGDDQRFAWSRCRSPPTRQRPRTARCSSSPQLFTAVGSGMALRLLGITSPPLPSLLSLFHPLSPPLSPFLPPWSHSSCFITTMLPLHKQTTDAQMTSDAEAVSFRLSHDRSHGHGENLVWEFIIVKSSCSLWCVGLGCCLEMKLCSMGLWRPLFIRSYISYSILINLNTEVFPAAAKLLLLLLWPHSRNTL